jgi:polyisoprenoid-binding protein YceI
VPNHGSDDAITGRWQLDSQRSSVEFGVRHFWGLVTVKGRFAEYAGHLNLNANPAIELTINAATLQTGNRKRDKHLRSADFFDTTTIPTCDSPPLRAEPRGETLHVRGDCQPTAGRSHLHATRACVASTVRWKSKRSPSRPTETWA